MAKAAGKRRSGKKHATLADAQRRGAATKSEQATKANPFDLKWSRSKHIVLSSNNNKPGSGRNKPTIVGKSVQFRGHTQGNRRGLLLDEWQKRTRRNEFKDKRIGERENDLTLEDKMLQRFANQQKQKSFHSHGQQQQRTVVADEAFINYEDLNLRAKESFPRYPEKTKTNYNSSDTIWKPSSGEQDEDELDEKLGETYVSEAHFGGGLLQQRDESKEAREERINLMIKDAKREKYEKQKAKDEVIGMTEEVDNQWRSLLHDGINVLSLYSREKGNAALPPKHAHHHHNKHNDDGAAADDDDDDAERDTDHVAELGDSIRDKAYDNAIKTMQITVPQPVVTNFSSNAAESTPIQPHSIMVEKPQRKSTQRRVTFPDSFNVFRSTLDSCSSPTEQLELLDDMLAPFHPQLHDDNKKRINQLFIYILRYMLVKNDHQTQFELIPLLMPSLLPAYWNFSANASLSSISRLLLKIESDTDGFAPNAAQLSFLRLLSTLVANDAVDRNARKESQDKQLALEQTTSQNLLWSGVMQLTEKLIRKPAHQRCAVFKRLFAISIATSMLQARQTAAQYSKVLYSTAVGAAMHQLSDELSMLLDKHSNDRYANDDAETLSSSVELFNKNSAWNSVGVRKAVWLYFSLLEQLMALWQSLDSFSVIFSPIIDNVNRIPAIIRNSSFFDLQMGMTIAVDEIAAKFEELKPKSMVRLRFLRSKPKPLTMLEPKMFEDEKTKVGRRRRELRSAVRRELKSTKREIRRDNQFIAQQRHTEQLASDKQRRSKVSEIMGGLQRQEHEHKVFSKSSTTKRNNKRRIRL